MKRIMIGVVSVLLGSVLPGSAGAEALWVHARVETQHVSGQEITYFRAFTTSDPAGNNRTAADRICIAGTAHQAHEKCEENVSFVEVVERVPRLPGAATLCAEARATAYSGSLQVNARARTCPEGR